MHNETKQLKLSIVIPAYNEAQNIGHLLSALLQQTIVGASLHEIIVASDGSTDDTVAVAKGITDERITVLDLTKRRGLCKTQNELVSRATGDVVVLLNADILPQHEDFITQLIKPLVNQEKHGVPEGENPIGIVACNYDCATPRTFIEKVLIEAFYIKRDAMSKYRNGDNLYMCVGCARAFSKEFLKDFRWADTYGEDAHSYLSCKKAGFAFKYAPEARALFRVPSVYNDYIKQSVRYREAREHLKNNFSEELVTREFAIPKGLLLKSFIQHFFTHPILTFSYFCMFFYTYIYNKTPTATSYKPHTEVPSTKDLASDMPLYVTDTDTAPKTVTVGIPAFNEEKNIGKLIDALFAQDDSTYVLEQIIVVSDGSTDNTNEIVESYKDVRVKLIPLEKQAGVANAQNIIVREAKSDVVVLVDADILPEHNRLIAELIKPFCDNSKTSLVSGPAYPTTPKTLFERIIAISERCKTEAFSHTRGGDNIYCCRGRVCALSRAFYTTITWPDKHADDSYSYLFCKQTGGTFVYASNASVLFRAPQNFEDHKKQSIRYVRGRFTNEDFPGMDVKQEYALDVPVFIKTSIKYFLRHPLLFPAYVAVLCFVRIQALIYGLPKDSSIWAPIKSSKDI